ncbi:MAG TPA: tryptophan--tRNA ligase, partial [Colwellia sp.]|nr:tryptophan--tRNA ligase [Colwellia sp.]
RSNVREDAVEMGRWYLACGLDPDKACIYRQSDIDAIPGIALALSNIASVGMLQTCTTFKDKKAKVAKDAIVSAGLQNYPVLMAADIISMAREGNNKTMNVPVGDDQLQHLELIRSIINRANKWFDLEMPLPYCPDDHKPLRLPGISGTSGKMGKSDNNTITLLDSDDLIIAKVMSAVTDSGESDGEMSQGLSNLFQFAELFCEPLVHTKYLKRYEAGERKFYGDFKSDIACALIKLISPIRKRYHSDPSCSIEAAEKVLAEGAKKANNLADNCLLNLRKAMNF